MKVKAIDIVKSIESIKKVNSLNVSLNVAKKLAKTAKEMETVMEEYHKREQALLEEYGEAVEGSTGQYNLPQENIEQFSEKMTALQDEEIDLDIVQIKLDDLGESAELSAGDILSLEWFFLPDPHLKAV